MKGLESTSTLTPTALIAPQLPSQFYSPYHYQQQQQPGTMPPSAQVPPQQQPPSSQVQFLTDYNQKIHQVVAYYPKNEHDLTPSQQQINANVQYVSAGMTQNGTLMKKKSTSVPRYKLREIYRFIHLSAQLTFLLDIQISQYGFLYVLCFCLSAVVTTIEQMGISRSGFLLDV